MRGELFSRVHEEVASPEALSLQNGHLLRARLGAPVIAASGSVVAHQGRVSLEHWSFGPPGRLLRRAAAAEDSPLMTVSGQGDVFLAVAGRHVFLVDLEGPQDALAVAGASLLAFESSLEYDVRRAAGPAASTFDALLRGHGRVALTCHATPLILDCSQRPTFVDLDAVVCWSPSLEPTLQPTGPGSATGRSARRGGSGETFQYAFHGPGFVVVQPSAGSAPAPAEDGSGRAGGFLGDVLDG